MGVILLNTTGCEAPLENVNSSQETLAKRFGTKDYERIPDPEKQIQYQVDTILDDNKIVCINESPIVTNVKGNNTPLPYLISYDQNTKTILVKFKPPLGSDTKKSYMVIRLEDGLVTIHLNNQ
jgi:hypothetical protein